MKTAILAACVAVITGLSLMLGLSLVYAQDTSTVALATSTAATGLSDLSVTGAAIVDAFNKSVLGGIGAVILFLSVLTRYPKFQQIAKLGPNDKADFIPPLISTILVGFTAAAGASLVGPWYAAVGAGLVAGLASTSFTGFIREVRD